VREVVEVFIAERWIKKQLRNFRKDEKPRKKKGRRL